MNGAVQLGQGLYVLLLVLQRHHLVFVKFIVQLVVELVNGLEFVLQLLNVQ